MVSHFQFYSHKIFIITILILLGCSEPELYNPNDPASDDYIVNANADSSINHLSIIKTDSGLVLQILGTLPNVDQWLVDRIQGTDSTTLQEFSLNTENGFKFLDSTTRWNRFYTYKSRGENQAGLSRIIDSVTIYYGFEEPQISIDKTTSENSRSANIRILLDQVDASLKPRVNMIFDDTTIIERTNGNSNVDFQFSLRKFPLQKLIEYDLYLVSGKDSSSIIPNGKLYLDFPRISPTSYFQLLGNGKGKFQFNFQSISDTVQLTGNDTINMNHYWFNQMQIRHLPTNAISMLNVDGSAFVDELSGSVVLSNYEIKAFHGQDSVWISNLIGPTVTIPEAISEMVLIHDDQGRIGDFFMDMYEVSYEKWNDLGLGLPEIFSGDASVLPYFQANQLLPIGGIGLDEIQAYFADEVNSLRELPSRSQWELAAGDGVFPLSGESYLLDENCNYLNSNDSYENFPPYPAVPVDFFDHIEKVGYEVNGYPPAPSYSSHGIYQMAGNMLEWVISVDDTTVTGGSFWHLPSDSLFRVGKYLNSNYISNPAPPNYGFRTVINIDPEGVTYITHGIQYP